VCSSDLALAPNVGEPAIIGLAQRRFAFRIGSKPTLPPELIVHACLCFVSAAPSIGKARTIGIGRLLDEPGAPGRAFKLSELALCEAFEHVARRHPAIQLTETAGVLQLSLDEPPDMLAATLLKDLYRRGSVA
jgi:hypothetical protein